MAAIGTAVATLFPSSKAGAQGLMLGFGRNRPRCFLTGTPIMTADGEVSIEHLNIGDRIITLRGESVAIKWIGRHSYKRSGRHWSSQVVPIRISRHALGPSIPHTDLYLSPGHRLFVDGMLVNAQDLVNGLSIVPALPDDREKIEYFHVVLDTHEVILAAGAPAETFLLNSAAAHEGFANFAEFARLYPGHRHHDMKPFAPSAGYGGLKHIKALLRPYVGRFVPAPLPVENTCDRISARAEKMEC
jgi:hypothetical protein